MPIITVDGPAVEEVGKKREFVRDVTDAATRLYGFPEKMIAVLIRENRPENVGVGGQLVIDRPEPSQ